MIDSEAHGKAGTTAGPRVVVGVSPTPSGRAAVRFAADAALGRGAALDLVRVWCDVGWFFSMTIADAQALPESERADGLILREAVATAHAAAPTVQVIEDFAEGDLYSDLLERTSGAELLVLGADVESIEGSDGSIDEWFQRHAHCPVVVVDADGQVLSRETALSALSTAPRSDTEAGVRLSAC